MQALTRDSLRGLMDKAEPPCLSLYQPTHRHHPDNQKDRTVFKNLVRSMEESLRQKYPVRDVRGLLEPFQALTNDASFWNHTLDGLAVLGAPGTLRVFHLQRPVKELVVVADTFYLKPLWRYAQSADRYQVLCLTRASARVFEGNRYALDELDLDGFPATLTEALGDQVTEPSLSARSAGAGPAAGALHHGQGSRRDELDKDTERFFRVIDREVLARYSKPSGLPLVLAALTEHQPVFRAVSQNPALLPAGVEVNPEALDADRLRAAVWGVVEPQYLARLARLSAEFQEAAAHQKGTADLSDAARAAVAGRVATLLVEADRVTPGRLDPTTGAIEPASLDHPEVGCQLDDLAEAVLRNGGDVVVVPKERMPTASGLAATFRY
jgi:hypothetical protein